MKSVRVYLIAVTLSVICLTNFLAALIGYRYSLKTVDALLNEQIIDRFKTVMALSHDPTRLPEDLFNGDTLFQIFMEDKILSKSTHSPKTPLAKADGNFHLISHQGHPWHVYGKTFPAQKKMVIVALKIDFYNRLTEDVLLKAVTPIIWGLPVIALLIFMIIHFGLKPLKKLALQLSLRQSNDFSMLAVENYTVELKPIIDSLNTLFQRLNDAFDREKNFSADAAHELRSPLAALKVNLHNLDKQLGNNETVHALTMATNRMGRSIEQLLSLHHASLENQETISSCEIYSLAQKVITELYESIQSKEQQIELLGEPIFINANEFAMSVVLKNLIDNAIKYSPKHANIQIELGKINLTHVYICVEDSGPGIPSDQYQRALDRFYRVGGDGHHSEVIGSGLGLSIVHKIIKRYQGEIQLSQSKKLGGLAVKIIFPNPSGVN